MSINLFLLRRVASFIVDWAVYILYMVITGMIIAVSSGSNIKDIEGYQTIVNAVSISNSLFYFIFITICFYKFKQTLGMKLFKLELVKLDGSQITPWNAFFRSLSFLIYHIITTITVILSMLINKMTNGEYDIELSLMFSVVILLMFFLPPITHKMFFHDIITRMTVLRKESEK